MGDMIAVALEKAPAESRLYGFDFQRFAEVVAGETIVSGTVVPDIAGLTITGTAGSGSQLQARIAGGTKGTVYRLTITATTSGGNVLGDFATLSVAVPKGY
jgi:hypothetical protein